MGLSKGVRSVTQARSLCLSLSLSQLCISDGRLKTAASYLIIIQNLEASTVSRQVGFHGYHGYHSYMHAVLPSLMHIYNTLY